MIALLVSNIYIIDLWNMRHKKVQENENVHPNKGGLIYAYYKNISKQPITLASLALE